jgi:hypothetical protein
MNTLSDDDARMFTYDYFRDVLTTPVHDRPWASADIYYRCTLYLQFFNTMHDFCPGDELMFSLLDALCHAAAA